MIALIQRVTSARVEVAGQTVGAIDRGLLALIGVERDDDEASGQRLLERILGYRVFDDRAGKMNVSLAEGGGGLLLVSQFTLAADTRKGRRPSFTKAAPPHRAQGLFDALVALAHTRHQRVATGQFGAAMAVHLVNDGPVTFWLQSGGDGAVPPRLQGRLSGPG
ncbi:MAG: D-aminoacyl-tRNA deacylase [Candidatus Competibacterales bacterium]